MKISKMEFSQVNPTKIKSTAENNQSLKIEFIRDKSSGHNDQENFDNVIKNSPLDDRIPNKNSLKKLGYIVEGKEKVGSLEVDNVKLDMNGGKTYHDKNGNKIRICNFDGERALGMKGATAVTYENKDGNFTNTVYYDPDGNPVKGNAYVKNDSGTVTKYEYEYDFNGNKILKNKHTLNDTVKEIGLGDGRVIVIPADGKPDVISDKPLDLEPSDLIDKLKNVDLTKNNNKIINDKQVKKADTPESILENFGIKFNIKERIERQDLDDDNAFKLLKAIKNDEVWYYDVFENEDGSKYYKYSNTDR
ncbi:hypothetical protein IJF81_00205, partial [bacterium]|nr:hypothetical protein [bacterium]